MRKLDWSFICREEGRSLKGYVPNPETSESGVTFGCGVDLGKVNPKLLPLSLQPLLTPYCCATKGVAVALIDNNPCTLTEEQANELDAWAAQDIYQNLVHHWDMMCIEKFDDIPERLATVVMSVAYQYGSPWAKCPRFWIAATALNIPAVIHELMYFGDAYPTRRKAEASYLKGD